MYLQSILRRTDSYKFSHKWQHPVDTTHIHTYIESRGGEFEQSVFFGLQMYLQSLAQPITQADVDETAADATAHGEPFNHEGWTHIVQQHEGRLPLVIKAVPEGTVLPVKNVLVTVENTDPACFWLPGHVETSLLRAVWYPTTVCSLSFACKVDILRARMKTCDNPHEGLGNSLHDFGARGTSSAESAEIGGAAHLVNFMGSDTFECLAPIRRIYRENMAAYSVPAAEHSTITSWRQGKKSREEDAYANMLDQFAKPGGIVAVVSDSYDLWNAIENIWGGSLRQRVIDSGARIVIRPDSGQPDVVPITAIEMLAKHFGYTTNNKGYKVLPPCVRVIQGDGITRETISVILENLAERGYSAENIVFGMGGGLLQQVNRDTMKFAMKASARRDSNGVWHDVFKNPVDDQTKRSKAGRLALVIRDGRYQTVPLDGNENCNLLETVFENGEVLRSQTFADIRMRAHSAALATVNNA